MKVSKLIRERETDTAWKEKKQQKMFFSSDKKMDISEVSNKSVIKFH